MVGLAVPCRPLFEEMEDLVCDSSSFAAELPYEGEDSCEK